MRIQKKHNLLYVDANECPLSTNTDPVERHMNFTNMRNEPLYQSERKAGCTTLEPNKKRYNSDSNPQIKPPKKASRKSVIKALGAPNKTLAKLNFEKYKLPPPIKPLSAYTAFSSWNRYEICLSSEKIFDLEEIVQRCRVVGPHGYVVPVRGNSRHFCEIKDIKSTNITSAERNKIVANAWNSISEIERTPFFNISEKDKIRYSQDVQAYFEAVQKAKENAVQIIGEKEKW